MLTNPQTIRKLNGIHRNYHNERFEHVAEITMSVCETREHHRTEPGRGSGVAWRCAPAGTRWGDEWISAWFRGNIRVPAALKNRRIFIQSVTGGVDTLVQIDGICRGMLYPHGRGAGIWQGSMEAAVLDHKARIDRPYHISLEAYAGHNMPHTELFDATASSHQVARNSCEFKGAWIGIEREDVSTFCLELRILLDCANNMPDGHRRGAIWGALEDVFAVVDAVPCEHSPHHWRPALAKARAIMKPLLLARNGTTAPFLGLAAHSHIDTAWLWPLAETTRKCARTFSSVLTLMEQYPDFVYLQSAPYHADVIRREYPELFGRIKKAVAQGRWEPNGGMWIEPDCSIPSGESLVRQLLVGVAWTREQFGYTPDTLWLPDCFGFSAGLPQILRKSGIPFFSTTKMSWNDTTIFPYDTFQWHGIDGSAVLAHFATFANAPTPYYLMHDFSNVQHTDSQDRRFAAFGYGDGGGGPQADMLEMAQRIGNLQGCPRTGHTTLGAFMRRMEKSVRNTPHWHGEMYLENHRGVFTSQANLKKGNRGAEIALRDAEFLSTIAALQGRAYPGKALLALWKTLLTNQFHDILPGSSIACVNDQAIAEFAQCRDGAREITNAALASLCGRPRRGSPDMTVVNTLSWARTGEMALEGAAPGTSPSAEGVTSQWVTTVRGTRELRVAGVSIPALSAISLPMSTTIRRNASPFRASANRFETPLAMIKTDTSGAIVSWVIRESGREMIPRGGSVNRILMGENAPASADNWNIDADQRLKMRTIPCQGRAEVVADGPLQMRIQTRWRISPTSTMTQHMVLHADSPRVDFETLIDWDEKHALLKAASDIDIRADFARFETQFGFVERPTHANLPGDRARFEVCHHKWADLSDNGFGVALLNDCRYGISVLDNTLALSLMKAGTGPDPRGDKGVHHLTYTLLPHSGTFSVPGVTQPAYELNIPPLAITAHPAKALLRPLCTVDAPNVIVESVKWAESGDAFVLRLYEAGKCACRAVVTFGPGVRRVCETNLLEERPVALAVRANAVHLSMSAFEIKTLRCEIAGSV